MAEQQKKVSAESDGGAEQVQRAVDAAEAVGYIGVKTDPEPNESYTVAGVLAADKKG